MVEQTLPCHARCEQLGMTHILHITPTIKLLDEIIQLIGANCLQISTWPFVAPYVSSMSHNNGVVTTFRFEYEECKTIGDNNCVPYPWILFPFYMVNLTLTWVSNSGPLVTKVY
jgi:hypothetical protein